MGRTEFTNKVTIISSADTAESLFLTPPEGKFSDSTIIMDMMPIPGPGYVNDSSGIGAKISKTSNINHLFAYTDMYGRTGDLDIIKDIIRETLKKFHKDFFIAKYKEIGRTKSTLDQFVSFINDIGPMYADAFNNSDLFRIVTNYVTDRLYLDQDKNEFEYKLSAKDIFVITCTSVVIKLVEILSNPLRTFLSNPNRDDTDTIYVTNKKLNEHIRNMMTDICTALMSNIDEYCTQHVHYLDEYTTGEFDTAENLAEHVEYKIKASRMSIMENYIDRIHVSNGVTLTDIKSKCFTDAIKSIIRLVPTIAYDVNKTLADPLHDYVSELIKDDPTIDKFRRVNSDEVGMPKGEFLREFGYNMVQVSSHIVSRLHDIDQRGVLNQLVYMQTTINRSVVANSDVVEELSINSPAAHRHILEIKDFIMSEMKRELPDCKDITRHIKYSKSSKASKSPLAMFLLGDSLERLFGQNVSKYMTENEIKYTMSYLYNMDPILSEYQLRDVFLSEKGNSISNSAKNMITSDVLKDEVAFMLESLNNTVRRLASHKYDRFSLSGVVEFDVPYARQLSQYLVDKVNGELGHGKL